MDDFQRELNELKQFIAELKADRAATKDKEKREAWTKYVSLTVVIIAVVAAIAAQWSGKYGGRIQISQAQASDQWSYYQSKSIKQNLYEVGRAQIIKEANTNDPVFIKEQKEFEGRIARYEAEKKEIKEKAEKLEGARDAASKSGGYMGNAVAIFSVSIAMASICMVTKKKPLWFISMGLACVGVVEMLLAWK